MSIDDEKWSEKLALPAGDEAQDPRLVDGLRSVVETLRKTDPEVASFVDVCIGTPVIGFGKTEKLRFDNQAIAQTLGTTIDDVQRRKRRLETALRKMKAEIGERHDDDV